MTMERKGITMKKVKLALLLVLVGALVLLVLQNRGAWQVKFLWMSGELPGILLLFITTATGFAAGIIAALLMRGHKDKNTIK